MTVDETELELLARPSFTRNPFIRQAALTADAAARLVLESYRIVRFQGRLLIEVSQPYAHFEPLYADRFDRLAGPILLGSGRSQVNDTFHYLKVMAADLSHNDNLIAFGNQGGHGSALVWDTDRLQVRTDIAASDCMWRSPYTPANLIGQPVPAVMELAGGDQGHYDDIMQSIAPLVMKRKPEGIIWWLGYKAGGMAALTASLHTLFPGQLADLNIKRLGGRRVLPDLNKIFGNVVTETSDGQVNDSSLYKSLASHDDITVHRYHSQGGLIIRGNVHHIFPTLQRPTFNSVNHAVLRRTIVIPMTSPEAGGAASQHELFGDVELEQLLDEILRYARRIKQQNGTYRFSSKL